MLFEEFLVVAEFYRPGRISAVYEEVQLQQKPTRTLVGARVSGKHSHSLESEALEHGSTVVRRMQKGMARSEEGSGSQRLQGHCDGSRDRLTTLARRLW